MLLTKIAICPSAGPAQCGVRSAQCVSYLLICGLFAGRIGVHHDATDFARAQTRAQPVTLLRLV